MCAQIIRFLLGSVQSCIYHRAYHKAFPNRSLLCKVRPLDCSALLNLNVGALVEKFI